MNDNTVDRLDTTVKQAVEGDRAALAALFLELRPVLLRAARSHLRGRQPCGRRPSDLAQEACVLALRGFAQFRGQTGRELRTWLQQILRNAIIQALRRSGAAKRSDQATDPLAAEPRSPAPTTSALVAGRQGFRRIIAAMAKLPERQRQAIYLRLLREHSLAEISAALDESEQAVASLIKRGLSRLRTQLLPAAPRLRRVGATRLDEAVLSYLRHADLGTPPPLTSLCAEYPDCAATLVPLLAWLDETQAALTDQ